MYNATVRVHFVAMGELSASGVHHSMQLDNMREVGPCNENPCKNTKTRGYL